MTSRVFGIETEYGIACLPREGERAPLDADHAARELFMPLIERYRSTNVFLPNGGRMYLDVGSHPEYATAECSTLRQVIAQDGAGQALLADLAQKTNDRFVRTEVPGVIHLFKNNVDSQGNSCGCHENYLLRRDSRFRDVADALVSFFVARQSLVGAGWVRPDGTYVLSQRADYMDDAVSAATTRSRPIINTRDEPLARATDFRRLHVIVSDSSIAQGSTLLKVGLTHLLLSALEAGCDIADLAFADPLETLRRSSADLTASTRFALRDGREWTVVEYLREIAERVSGFALDDDLADAVWDLWGRGMTALQTGEWEPVATELDFAAKAAFFDQARVRAGRDLPPATLRRLDLAYHDITPAGVGAALRGSGLLRDIVPPAEVDSACHVPPATTRAHLRGRAIRVAEERRRDLMCDWMHVRLGDSRLSTVTLSDPFATTDPAIDQILDEMERGSA